MKHLLTLNRFFIKYKWYLILGIVFVTLSNYFSILIPKQIQEALDLVQTKILEYKDLPTADQGSFYQDLGKALVHFAIVIAVLAVIKGLMMFFMRQTIIVMSRYIEYDMRNEIFEHINKLDQSFMRGHQTGDIMARISEDVSKVREYLGPGILYGINLITLFAMTIYAMLRVDLTLTIFALLPLPILSISIYYVSKLINKKSLLIKQQLSTLNSTAQETFSGIRVVKSYVKEASFSDYFSEESEEFKKRSLSLARVEAYFQPLMALLISMSTLLVVLVGGFQYYNGHLTAGNIAEFILYVNMLTWPVTSIGWIASIIQTAEASQSRINHLMLEKPSIINVNHDVYDLNGEIEFENVTFVYPNTGIKALDRVSFKIGKGERVAIMGRTASGKTTIAELLMRMFDVTEGHIYIDGKDIREHNIHNLRDRIGYVPQDVFLFSDTISRNIAFGRPGTDIETIKKYADYASVKKEIEGLPEQFDTVVGERGVTLSGGQKQRVSIARALIKNPDIVLLDDALSAVDTTTEQNILSFLNEELEGKTAIIITHRAGNQLDYDRILVLEKGRLAESGTHEQLIVNNGFYAQIYNQQQLQQTEI